MSNKVSIKKRIKNGEVVVGPFCIVPSGTMIDTLGYSGMDFCILDTEHGPLDMQTITDLILVAKGTGVDPIVRVGENNERLILRALDIGAAGVQEAIYSILMMNNNFICESANIKNIDPLFENIPIVKNKIENVNLGYVLSNSFGFGGTNATLTFKHPDK